MHQTSSSDRLQVGPNPDNPLTDKARFLLGGKAEGGDRLAGVL